MTDDEINYYLEETKKTHLCHILINISGYGGGNRVPAYYELI